MRVTHPHKLATSPLRVDRGQFGHMTELNPAQKRLLHALCAHRDRTELGCTQRQPKPLGVLVHRWLNLSGHGGRRIRFVVMHPQLTRFGHQACVTECLGEDGQPVTTTFGQGTVGVDDQQVKRWFGLEWADQQTVTTVSLASNRTRTGTPAAFGRYSGQCP